MSKIFDTESEMAIISLILKNPDQVYSVNDLKPFMFSTTATQIIWEGIERVKEENLIPEPTILFSRIEAEGKLVEAGGKDFLDTFLQSGYKIENLQEYQRNIVNNFRLKKVLTLASDIQAQVKASIPIEEVMGKVKDSLASLENFSIGSEIVSMLSAVKDTWELIKKAITNPGVPGFDTGLNRLSLATYGFNPGKLWVIAARPGMGKTASMLNMALALGSQNVPTLVLSKEMKYTELVRRMIATDSSVSIANIMLGTLTQDELNRIQTSIENIKNYPIIINDKFSPFDLISAIRKTVVTKGVKVVFVDYLQLLTDRGEEQTEELGKIIRSLKLLSGELDITIVVLSQLNRLVELRVDKRPILSDIRQCGNVEEDVDIAVFLYRDEMYNAGTKHLGKIEYLLKKNRDGALGTLMFSFEAPTNRVTDEEDI